MGVGVVTWIAAAMLLASMAPPVSAQAPHGPPLRKLELTTFTCEQLAAEPHRVVREAILVYMNGYLDGARKATTWDAEVVGKRIDEVVRLCAADPKLVLLEAFNRAWSR